MRQYLYCKFPNCTRRHIGDGIFVTVIGIDVEREMADLSERKEIEEPKDEVSSYAIIYATKLATLSVSAGGTPFGVVIDEGGTASSQRQLFKSLWNFLDN